MAYCPHCGHQNQEGARFCGDCGKPLSNNSGSQQQTQQTSSNGSLWIDSLNDYVGNKNPANLNWKVLFSDVFKGTIH